MATVYRSRQPSLGRPVAVKVLHGGGQPRSEAQLQRFRREARAIASLAHPAVVTLHDFGVFGAGQPYMVMELVPGRPLSAALRDRGVTGAAVVRMALDLLDALEHAHGQGIIHRDIKPANIMVLPAEQRSDRAVSVRLLDFGLAKSVGREDALRLTDPGAIYGSPLYISPEQAQGTTLDARTDLYSLSAVLFEAFAGHPPFRADSHLALASIRVIHPAPRLPAQPWVPGPIADLVARGLERDPAQRFASAAEMAAALEACAGCPELRLELPGPLEELSAAQIGDSDETRQISEAAAATGAKADPRPTGDDTMHDDPHGASDAPEGAPIDLDDLAVPEQGAGPRPLSQRHVSTPSARAPDPARPQAPLEPGGGHGPTLAGPRTLDLNQGRGDLPPMPDLPLVTPTPALGAAGPGRRPPPDEALAAGDAPSAPSEEDASRVEVPGAGADRPDWLETGRSTPSSPRWQGFGEAPGPLGGGGPAPPPIDLQQGGTPALAAVRRLGPDQPSPEPRRSPGIPSGPLLLGALALGAIVVLVLSVWLMGLLVGPGGGAETAGSDAPTAGSGVGQTTAETAAAKAARALERAEQAFAAGDYERADEHARLVMRYDAHAHRARLLLAQALFARREFAEAESHLRLAVRAEPNSVDYRLALAIALDEQVGQESAAQSLMLALEPDIAASPDHAAELPRFYARLGRRLLAGGRAKEALQFLTKSLGPEQRDAIPWFLTGEALMTLKHPEKAEGFYREALARQPALIRAYERLATALLLRERPDQDAAIAVLIKGIATDKAGKAPALHRQLGYLYRDVGKTDEAVAALDAYLKAAPARAPDRRAVKQELRALRRASE